MGWRLYGGCCRREYGIGYDRYRELWRSPEGICVYALEDLF